MNYLKSFLSSQNLMPQGHCILWRPDLLWVSVGSDAVIAAAYYAIPIALVCYVHKRKDMEFNWIVRMFAMFILAAGTIHLCEIVTIWHPYYGAEDLVKLWTAAVSAATAVILWPLMPKFLSIPSPKQLGQKIQELEAENIQRRSLEERFRVLVETVQDYAIFILDLDGNVKTWNLGAERITGYQADEVIGHNFAMLHPRSAIGSNLSRYRLDVAKSTGKFEDEGVRRRKDGTQYYANVVITAIRDNNGKVTGFAKIIRDITSLKAASDKLTKLNEELEQRVNERTRALHESEQQLRMIANALPVIVARFDLQYRLIFANAAAQNWLRNGDDDVIGKNLLDLIGPERFQWWRECMQQTMSGLPVSHDQIVKKDHERIVLNYTFIPNRDDSGNVDGFLVVATNITRHKEVEEELKKAKEQADAANAAKTAFLANMSHEIRTPLGAVLGFSELMVTTELSPSEKINSIEAIKRNGRILSTLINDILDLSKVESGKLEIEKVDIPLEDVIKDISSLLSLEASAKGISLLIHSEGAVPNRLETDPLRLRQILLNVIGNAIKFTDQGSVEVKIKMAARGGNGLQLAFIVKDTGCGISPEHGKKLFQPFTQADVSTTRQFGGSGLGLALARKLAKALGGDIELAESAVGQGSRFIVYIDPGAPDKVLFDSLKILPEMIEEEDPVVIPNRLRQLKVLLAEDNHDNQMLASRLLRMIGIQVDTANNGAEAVYMASATKYDLILMDLQMPKMDGFEATQEIRERGYDGPIIALTAHVLKDERRRCLASGFDDHVGKPIDRDALMRVLLRHVS